MNPHFRSGSISYLYDYTQYPNDDLCINLIDFIFSITYNARRVCTYTLLLYRGPLYSFEHIVLRLYMYIMNIKEMMLYILDYMRLKYITWVLMYGASPRPTQR